MSAVWRYFKINSEESKVTRSICNEVFSRGGSSKKSYTTSSLVNYLQRKHYEAYLVVKQAQDSASAAKVDSCCTSRTMGN